ncbi:MAG: hypothetical protein HS116_24925 [Planctomycetes bacterium]|nr:hypothetical protein [Planctomycetota bacterium]
MAAWLRALLRLLIEAIISETLNFLDRPDVIADTPDPVLETIDPVESDSVRNADLLNRFRGLL